MQFIPSTWAVVGVDGDSDGTRDPQDIDDAALATAVYLCSGDDDLSSEQGQRASVYRYNHSNDYVDLVLGIMQAYLDGDFSAVPTSTLTSGVITPDATASTGGDGGGRGGNGGDKDGDKGGKGDDGDTGDDPSPTKGPTPTQAPTQSPTQTQSQSPSPTSNPTQSPTKDPTKDPTVVPTVDPTTSLPTTTPTLPPLPTNTITATLTWAEAQAQCLASGISALDVPALNACIDGLMNP
ncbi:hypothetical protein NYO98_01000 [Nocardioides sp. STR2]|uniref:Transglycosylase SLT domain-containing protein n=2 Tax=Nocardioides pini TaxID=2975053 RepID=A0ABT4C7A8_9ACTN|nr:hypothetical protein [Nocardioides pini]